MSNNLDFAAICQNLQTFPRVYIAYSGGSDSQVLLHGIVNHMCTNNLNVVCSKANIQPLIRRLLVVYINHGLSRQDYQVDLYCAQVCADLGVEYKSITVCAAKQSGISPEQAARIARYQAFASLMQRGDCLVTAHHQDDQAETVLLQLLRGAGLGGLAAMPRFNEFATGLTLYRPLLAYTKSQLRTYAKHWQLDWIEDSSNLKLNYRRNFLRHRVLPILAGQWPALGRALARSARHCAQAQIVLDEYVHADYMYLYNNKDHSLGLNNLLDFSIPRQNLILRYWLRQLNLALPNVRILAEIRKQIFYARHDAQPIVHWANFEMRRYRMRLYAMPRLTPITPFAIPWNLTTELILPHNLGKLRANFNNQDPQRLLFPEDVTVNRIIVKSRTPGTFIRIYGDNFQRSIKYLFQKWGVPPWQRYRIPLIFYVSADDREQLIAIPGYGIAAQYVVKTLLKAEQRWASSRLFGWSFDWH